LPNPRITIETYLGKIPDQNVQVVKQQLAALNKQGAAIAQSGLSTSMRGITHDMDAASLALKQGNREFAINSVRMLAMRQGFESASQAAKGMLILLKDMFSAVGFLNTAMSIMISRFGTMIILFGAIDAIRRFTQSMKDATREFDTASRKLEGIVVPAFGSIRNAMIDLRLEMLNFAASYGVSIEQLSDTMFYLASAGRNHAQILQEVEAVQKLVVATSKDMTTTMGDNKQLVETFVGLLNIYGESIKDGADAMERAEHLASVFFGVFKTEQILITELAAGLQYSANQAKAMNISVEELVVSIAGLNTQMIKGSKAGTSYANALRETIQNSAKLKKNFGIEIGELSDGFSLLREVVLPIRQQMDAASDRSIVMFRLLQTYNIRSQKSIIAMADDIDKLIEKEEQLKTANLDLADAFEANSDSIKLQEQRFQNLQNIASMFFQLFLTGGVGYGAMLKDINTNLQSFTRIAAGFIGVMTAVNAAMLLGQRGVVGMQLKMWGLDGIAKKLGFTFNDHEKTLSNVKKIWDNLSLTFKYATGEISRVEYEIGLMKNGLRDNEAALKRQQEEMAATKNTVTAFGDAISTTRKVIDEFGREIDLTRAFNDLFGDRSLIAGLLAPLEDVDIGTNELNTQIERVLSSIERSTSETIDAIEEKIRYQYIGAYNAMMDKIREIPPVIADADNLIKQYELQFIADMVKIYIKGEEEKLAVLNQGNKSRLDSVRQANDAILNEYKLAQKLIRTTIGGESAFDFLQSGKPISEMGEISILPERVNIDSFKELLDIQSGLIEGAEDEINEYIKNSSSARLNAQVGYLNLLNSANDQVMGDIQARYTSYGATVNEITKVQRKAILDRVDLEEGSIRKIVEQYYLADRELIESTKARAEEQIKLNEETIKGLQSKPQTPTVIKDIDDIRAANQKLREEIILAAVDAWAQYQQNVDKSTEGVKRSIEEKLNRTLDESNERIRLLADTYKQAMLEIQTESDAIAATADEISNIFQQIKAFTGDEEKEKMLGFFSSVADAVSGLINIYTQYIIALEQVETQAARTALAVNAIFGVVGIAVGLAGAIKSAFGKEEERRAPLQQEYLDEQNSRAVSPDYGQARVINNRITLVPTFQLLDARQLSADQQRDIAEMIFDELQELQKANG